MAEQKNTTTKRVVLNSFIYSASGLLLKCFSFFLLPLYTAYLTTEDYGINSIATSFITTMGFVVAFSLFSAVMRFYVDLKDDPEQLKRFYGTISLFTLLSGLVFGTLLTLLRGLVSEHIFSGVPYYPIIFVSLIALLFHCQQLIFDNVLRSQQKAMHSSLVTIVFFFVTLGLNILFVVVLKMGALGTILASAISYGAHSIYFIIYMLATRQMVYCLDLPLLKKALKYSVPIMPHNLSTQIAVLVSKVLIGDAVSLGSLGVYTVATQFGNMADTVQNYVDYAYGPWLYEKLHAREEAYKSNIRKTVKLLCAVIGLFFLGISLFAHDYIILFIKKDYYDAWKYVPLIVLVFTIKTAYYFYVEVLFYYKKASKFLFTATVTSSILNVLLSYFLIPAWGVLGSIAADGISMVIRVLIIYFISRRFEDIGLKMKDFLLNFVMVSGFIAAGLSLSFFKYGNKFIILNFGFKVVIVLLYIGINLYLHREQIKPLMAFLKKKLHKNK
ncbi:MAG: oligosaccharide flippase family protein [Lachnospiraceae bacterium]|nr:oligosaccharide flippase family protein [Lachnospiraceae bacterium]MBQ9592266.1 oligosaccharide flippase family protein [Lachnospiraceae bacterium]MBR0153387.1 oligosaccharide flippase family protein [Lachnospiraceae bacterium]